MCTQRYGEVLRHDGERIDKQREVLVHLLLHLLLRAVMLTEETRALGYCLLVDGSTGGYDSCRIELHLHRLLATCQFACLHVAEVMIVLTCTLPHLQLTIEEALQRVVGRDVCLAL